MSTNPPEPRQPRPTDALREVLGLLLLLVGVAYVLAAAYRTSSELGMALSGVVAIAAGAALTVRRA